MNSFFLLTICFYTAFSEAKGLWGSNQSILDIEQRAKRDKDYEIISWFRPKTPLVLAIHGGKIEVGSGELAEAVANKKWSLYHFKAIAAPDFDSKILQSGFLHLTSHKFNEPLLIEMAKKSKYCLSLHGFPAEKTKVDFCVGGGNEELRKKLVSKFNKEFPQLKTCELCCPPYLGLHQSNVVNLCVNKGVQIEMSPKVRKKIVESKSFKQKLSRTIKQMF